MTWHIFYTDDPNAFKFYKWQDVSIKQPVEKLQGHGVQYEEDMVVWISGIMICNIFPNGRHRVKQLNS